MKNNMITIFMMIVMICVLSSCAGEAYLKTSGAEQDEPSGGKTDVTDMDTAGNEDITADKDAAADEGTSQGEESASKEGTDTTKEFITDNSSEPAFEDGKNYIYYVEIMEYDTDRIAEYLLGEDYSSTVSGDSATGLAIKSYESGQKQLIYDTGLGMRFEISRVSGRYPDPSLFTGSPVLSYQRPHISCLFPESPESIEGYMEAEKVCDEAADVIGFPYSTREAYYIDYDFLTGIMPQYFSSGGPAWAEENKNKGPGERTEPYWNEDETAFFFVYRMESIDNVPLGTLYDENVMTMLCSPKFGIVYISCPERYRIIGKEETEIKTADSIDQEFWVTAANRGLMNTDIEIISKELVYSSYEDYWSEDSAKNLLPYWKVCFRGFVSDKDLETIMRPDIVFRGEESSEWYFMLPAVIE